MRDVSQQLAWTGVRPGVALSSESGQLAVTYDASCHLLHGQKAAAEPIEMLRAIPNLSLVPLVGSDVCCGGAGVYNLMQPELSGRILDEKLAHIRATGACVVATGNPGCHMQIAAGARLAGETFGVCHPVELLDASYERAGFYDRARE